MVIVFSLVFWQWVIEVIWISSLCQCYGLCLVWNGDDDSTFTKMGYCVNVEDIMVHVCEVSDGK